MAKSGIINVFWHRRKIEPNIIVFEKDLTLIVSKAVIIRKAKIFQFGRQFSQLKSINDVTSVICRPLSDLFHNSFGCDKHATKQAARKFERVCGLPIRNFTATCWIRFGHVSFHRSIHGCKALYRLSSTSVGTNSSYYRVKRIVIFRNVIPCSRVGTAMKITKIVKPMTNPFMSSSFGLAHTPYTELYNRNFISIRTL